MSHEYLSKRLPRGLGPHYRGYQLIGDSNLLRFANQICHTKTIREPFIYPQIVRHNGFCVSGQSVGQLLNRVKAAPHLIGRQILLMIGTNSLRRKISLRNIITRIRKIVATLTNYGVESLIVCSTLPLLRHTDKKITWVRVAKYRKAVKRAAPQFCHIFLDVYYHFAPPTYEGNLVRNQIRKVFFQQRYRNGRSDHLHLNWKGINELRRLFDACITGINNKRPNFQG